MNTKGIVGKKVLVSQENKSTGNTKQSNELSINDGNKLTNS